MIDGYAMALQLIVRLLIAKGTPQPDIVASDLLRLGAAHGYSVDELAEWIDEQPFPLSVHDFPRRRSAA